MERSILIVDDEKNVRRTLDMVLSDAGYRVETVGAAAEALAVLETVDVAAIFLDIQLPGMSGMDMLRQIHEREPRPAVIMISGHASLGEAVEATRLGAFDFLEKPLDRERVLVSLRNALAQTNLKEALDDLRAQTSAADEMLGNSEAITALRETIEKVAPTRGRVLIRGESGTGKELVARALHLRSERAPGPFVKVNCAAIPSELIESELFGHERGAFTGAARRRKGQFLAADRGTLLLDEVGDMSAAAQAKLLRVLQTGEVRPVGGDRVLTADVRVLAATHRNLQDAIADGGFREDLYFRLNVVPIVVPPLRSRVGDVPLLMDHFLGSFAREYGRQKPAVDGGAMELLERYSWPGNVRELKNVCERLVILAGAQIGVADLPIECQGAHPTFHEERDGALTLKVFRERMEKSYLEHIVERYDWNVTRAAKHLGVERTNLHKKLKAFGISRR